MDIGVAVPYLLFLLGAIARVVIPYVQELIDTEGPLEFDLRYLIGQVIGVLVALIPLFVEQDFIESLTTMSQLALVLLGWAAGDIGRQGQKAIEKLPS